MNKTLLATAVLMALTGVSQATTTDYSNKTLNSAINVQGSGNSATGNNVTVTGTSVITDANVNVPAGYNEGIFIYNGATANFGGDYLKVNFTTTDADKRFAGIHIRCGDEDSSVIFNSKHTEIDVTGPGASNVWGYGLLVNGMGSKTASAKFTGEDVSIKATTKNYSAEAIDVQPTGKIDFSNSGDVVVHASSEFGATAVVAYGAVTFNNSGNVLLKSEITGNQTAQRNVVGVMSQDSSFTVTDKVQELRIDLKGAGVDFNPANPSFSDGTQAIAAQENAKIDIKSKSLVINIDVPSTLTDKSPSGTTSKQAFGINAGSGANVTLGNSTQTSITLNQGLGTAYGVNSADGGKISIGGDLNVNVTAKDDAIAIKTAGASSEVTLGGKHNVLVGDVIVETQGAMNFKDGSTAITGDVKVDGASNISLANSSVELMEGSTFVVKGALASKKGQIVLNDNKANTVAIENLTDGSSLEVAASGALNDKLGGDLDAFNAAFSITNGAEGTTVVMKEGLVAGETQAKLDNTGKVDASTVAVKVNSIMESTLELGSAVPMMTNRILTNDVRKRMGDLRASEGTYGAWARYDGGKLKSDNHTKTDFNTIQVGADTILADYGTRIGVAFSYTDGEFDASRSTSDIKAYGLAGYATWMADNGMFVDTVVRLAKFEDDLTVDKTFTGSMDNMAFSVSGEFGWRFDLNDLFYVEPQAEVMYTWVKGDDFNLGNARYSVDDVDNLTGRLGFASGIKCPNNRGDLYVRASVVHEFLGDSKITGTAAGSTGVVKIDGDDTWVEYGFGGNFNLTKNAYLWADVERTSGATIDTDWRATVGVRYAW